MPSAVRRTRSIIGEEPDLLLEGNTKSSRVSFNPCTELDLGMGEDLHFACVFVGKGGTKLPPPSLRTEGLVGLCRCGAAPFWFKCGNACIFIVKKASFEMSWRDKPPGECCVYWYMAVCSHLSMSTG